MRHLTIQNINYEENLLPCWWVLIQLHTILLLLLRMLHGRSLIGPLRCPVILAVYGPRRGAAHHVMLWIHYSDLEVYMIIDLP
jgi:hypothetical protein